MEVIKIKKTFRRNLLISKLKVAAYVRVSTKQEKQLNSLESQKKYFENKINQNENWTFVGIYADEGISGRNAKKRNNFLKMINEAKKGNIDLILTKSVSRFARNTVDALKYIRELKEIGIGIYFEEEKINTLDSSSEMILTVLSSVAQQEIETSSSRIKLGKEMMMMEGKMTNGKRCYGFNYNKKSKKVTINEYEANVVRIIYSKFLEFASVAKVIKYLKDNNYLDFGRTTNWEKSSIVKILKNKRYIGILEMKKYIVIDSINKITIKNNGIEDKYVVYDYNDKIIDIDTFNKVQEIFAAGKKREIKEKEYENKMYCGFCGYSLGTYNRNTISECILCIHNIKNDKKYCGKGKSLQISLVKDILTECLIKYLKSKNTNYKDKAKSNRHSNNKEKEIVIRQKSKNIEMFLNKKINKDNFINQNLMLDQKLKKLNDSLDILNKKIMANELLKKKEIEFYDFIVDKLDTKLSFYNLLSELNLVLIVGGYDEKNHKKPFMIRFILLNKHSELNLINSYKYYKKLTINNYDDFDYYVLLDYKSKCQKRMMTCINDNKKIINKNIRVRLEIVEEK